QEGAVAWNGSSPPRRTKSVSFDASSNEVREYTPTPTPNYYAPDEDDEEDLALCADELGNMRISHQEDKVVGPEVDRANASSSSSQHVHVLSEIVAFLGSTEH
ncbi:unnamed protein product, partial [Amoebophrya sp. A25]